MCPNARAIPVLSGSFVVTGTAMFVARRVGDKSFANQVAAEARAFRVARTPMQHDVDFVIRVLTLVAIFFGLLLVVSARSPRSRLMRRVQAATVIAGLDPEWAVFHGDRRLCDGRGADREPGRTGPAGQLSGIAE